MCGVYLELPTKKSQSDNHDKMIKVLTLKLWHLLVKKYIKKINKIIPRIEIKSTIKGYRDPQLYIKNVYTYSSSLVRTPLTK